MAWRLDESVVKGEIDNRIKGKISGRLWLLGRDDVVTLSLSGNCLRDMAGCKLTFVNPKPRHGDAVDLNANQEGVAGDMTASRKVRVLDVSVNEAMEMRRAGKVVPEHRGNCLYLEWFSRRNGRVVIETADFQMTISESIWCMSAKEEEQQALENRQAIERWMDELGQRLENVHVEDMSESMDEFAWEKHLRESDERAEKFSKLLTQYMDDPDRDRLIAREMGWSCLDEALDETERSGGDVRDLLDLDDLPEPKPDPLTEGVDWIRSGEGRVVHPLFERAHELVMLFWEYCRDQGLLDGGGDDDLQDLLFNSQTLGVKLAGALNGLGYSGVLEPGFVVACLKRALVFFDGAVAAMAKVKEKGLIEEKRLDDYRTALFEVREDMLRLMNRYRG